MKDNKNLKWTLKDIAKQYKNDNPDWTWRECWDKAKTVHRELRKLNDNMWNNNKTFFNMNTPFSFYYDKDGEFGDKYELRNGE